MSALDDDHLPAKQRSLRTLANLSRLDLGISEAIDAGIMARLAAVLDPAAALPGAEGSALVCSGLQTLWNLANTPDGKSAAIEAGCLDVLAEQLRASTTNIRRLAAGCVMAITIDKEGKYASLPCVDPLCELLFDLSADSSAVRDAVGALKNISEYPKARKAIDTWTRKKGAGDAMAQMFVEPIFDHKQWPASLRFQHQNVAPGGWASHEEAATRERWGYPRPFAM